jgi:hypothetical protein
MARRPARRGSAVSPRGAACGGVARLGLRRRRAARSEAAPLRGAVGGGTAPGACRSRASSWIKGECTRKEIQPRAFALDRRRRRGDTPHRARRAAPAGGSEINARAFALDRRKGARQRAVQAPPRTRTPSGPVAHRARSTTGRAARAGRAAGCGRRAGRAGRGLAGGEWAGWRVAGSLAGSTRLSPHSDGKQAERLLPPELPTEVAGSGQPALGESSAAVVRCIARLTGRAGPWHPCRGFSFCVGRGPGRDPRSGEKSN